MEPLPGELLLCLIGCLEIEQYLAMVTPLCIIIYDKF